MLPGFERKIEIQTMTLTQIIQWRPNILRLEGYGGTDVFAVSKTRRYRIPCRHDIESHNPTFGWGSDEAGGWQLGLAMTSFLIDSPFLSEQICKDVYHRLLSGLQNSTFVLDYEDIQREMILLIDQAIELPLTADCYTYKGAMLRRKAGVWFFSSPEIYLERGAPMECVTESSAIHMFLTHAPV